MCKQCVFSIKYKKHCLICYKMNFFAPSFYVMQFRITIKTCNFSVDSMFDVHLGSFWIFFFCTELDISSVNYQVAKKSDTQHTNGVTLLLHHDYITCQKKLLLTNISWSILILFSHTCVVKLNAKAAALQFSFRVVRNNEFDQWQ